MSGGYSYRTPWMRCSPRGVVTPAAKHACARLHRKSQLYLDNVPKQSDALGGRSSRGERGRLERPKQQGRDRGATSATLPGIEGRTTLTGSSSGSLRASLGFGPPNFPWPPPLTAGRAAHCAERSILGLEDERFIVSVSVSSLLSSVWTSLSPSVWKSTLLCIFADSCRSLLGCSCLMRLL
eukprot:1176696-Prorocentrum_minimum.AAC.2